MSKKLPDSIKTKYRPNTSGSIKLNVKFKSGCTSITIKKEIVALWFTFTGRNSKKDLMEFIYNECMPIWKYNHGKGLGDFIVHNLYRDVLDPSDYYNWRRKVKEL